MPQEFETVRADERLRHDTIRLAQLGVAEDLADAVDWTSWATLPEGATGRCAMVSRVAGVASGLVTVDWILQSMQLSVKFESRCQDGNSFAPGATLGVLSGPVRELLTAERLILNIVSRMCGVATLTARYVDRIAGIVRPAGKQVRLYDTRKTTTGWRRLEKYAVSCGGGFNHRSGLYDAFLIKDNHLALAGRDGQPLAPSVAVRRARSMAGQRQEGSIAPGIVEIEVDSIDQLREVLPASPDIVLVDNFSLDQLRQAVSLRDQMNPSVVLEASGGVRIETIAEIAATGVDRISCGALTHQATWLDIGLDWTPSAAS